MGTLPVVRPAASPCDACIAGCCRDFHLVIYGFDAWRIGRDLQLPLGAFARLFWCEPTAAGAVLLDPAEPRHAFRLQLRKVPELQGGFTERCAFLVTASGRGRCGIYQSRPLMCRTYPTVLHGGLLRATDGEHCPPGSWQDDALDVPAGRAGHRFRRQLAVLDERLARAWNERLLAGGARRAEEDYFRFVMAAHDELERCQPAWLCEPRPGPPAALPSVEAVAALDRVLANLK